MVDSEIQKLLNQNLELAKDNHKMLKRLQSNMRWGRFFHTLYWVLILGSAFGAYYFVQPYVDQLLEIYGNVQNVGKATPKVLDVLKSF